jgi:aspartate/tyrosine/aromatic aminotransferase
MSTIYNNSYFQNVFNKVDDDVIFRTQTAFMKDETDLKVNLGIGIYADENGKLPPVKERYLPLSGDPKFLEATEYFIFDKKNIKSMFKFQTCGGTGALSLAARIINYKQKTKPIYGMPIPTWPNHEHIFNGRNIFSNLMTPDFVILRPDEITPPNVMVLQTSCHNPTGIEYTMKEKQMFLDYAEQNNIVIVFDTAYLGLSGDFDNETKFLKMALDRNIEFFVTMSYSKIANAYGHRLGALLFRPLPSQSEKGETFDQNVKSHVELMIRTSISNSPRFGSDLIMEKYLGDNIQIEYFKQKIQHMAERINTFRRKLGSDLLNNGICNRVAQGKGMFSLLPFSENEIMQLQQKYHIYMLPNGRINICGLTNQNYEYVLESICLNHKEFNPIKV